MTVEHKAENETGNRSSSNHKSKKTMGRRLLIGQQHVPELEDRLATFIQKHSKHQQTTPTPTTTTTTVPISTTTTSNNPVTTSHQSTGRNNTLREQGESNTNPNTAKESSSNTIIPKKTSVVLHLWKLTLDDDGQDDVGIVAQLCNFLDTTRHMFQWERVVLDQCTTTTTTPNPTSTDGTHVSPLSRLLKILCSLSIQQVLCVGPTNIFYPPYPTEVSSTMESISTSTTTTAATKSTSIGNSNNKGGHWGSLSLQGVNLDRKTFSFLSHVLQHQHVSSLRLFHCRCMEDDIDRNHENNDDNPHRHEEEHEQHNDPTRRNRHLVNNTEDVFELFVSSIQHASVSSLQRLDLSHCKFNSIHMAQLLQGLAAVPALAGAPGAFPKQDFGPLQSSTLQEVDLSGNELLTRSRRRRHQHGNDNVNNDDNGDRGNEAVNGLVGWLESPSSRYLTTLRLDQVFVPATPTVATAVGAAGAPVAEVADAETEQDVMETMPTTIPLSDFSKLAKSIRCHPSLQQLTLNGNALNDEHWKCFFSSHDSVPNDDSTATTKRMTMTVTMANLQSLCWNHNEITDKSMNILLQSWKCYWKNKNFHNGNDDDDDDDICTDMTNPKASLSSSSSSSSFLFLSSSLRHLSLLGNVQISLEKIQEISSYFTKHPLPIHRLEIPRVGVAVTARTRTTTSNAPTSSSSSSLSSVWKTLQESQLRLNYYGDLNKGGRHLLRQEYIHDGDDDDSKNRTKHRNKDNANPSGVGIPIALWPLVLARANNSSGTSTCNRSQQQKPEVKYMKTNTEQTYTNNNNNNTNTNTIRDTGMYYKTRTNNNMNNNDIHYAPNVIYHLLLGPVMLHN